MRKIEVKLLVSRTDGSNRGDVILVPENEFGPMLQAGQIDPDFKGQTVGNTANASPSAAGPAAAAKAKAARSKARETTAAKPAAERAAG